MQSRTPSPHLIILTQNKDASHTLISTTPTSKGNIWNMEITPSLWTSSSGFESKSPKSKVRTQTSINSWNFHSNSIT
jgi:hypothetical protein